MASTLMMDQLCMSVTVSPNWGWGWGWDWIREELASTLTMNNVCVCRRQPYLDLCLAAVFGVVLERFGSGLG